MYKVVIIDDHEMVSEAIRSMIEGFQTCQVIYTAANGREAIERLRSNGLKPDLILLDLNMPVMNGFITMELIHEEFPDIMVLCLSMNDDRDSFLRIIEAGAHGFISKMSSPEELHTAIQSVMTKGCYYTDEMAEFLFRSLRNSKETESAELSDRERELLEHICTEMTYQQIAEVMCLSPKTVDGYRTSLFQKLGIRSRVGLAMYAVKHGYYDIA
ncbi:MAG: response regulator transcription factor [Flavobacteriales bacterium]|nr:response regulator transcription factor [Flavobacteriales bacterium]